MHMNCDFKGYSNFSLEKIGLGLPKAANPLTVICKYSYPITELYQYNN